MLFNIHSNIVYPVILVGVVQMCKSRKKQGDDKKKGFRAFSEHFGPENGRRLKKILRLINRLYSICTAG